MNRYILFVLFTTIIPACNNNTHSVKKELIDSSVTGQYPYETVVDSLSSNNGFKWKVDSSTSNNVKNLQTTIEKFNRGSDKSVSGYKIAAAGLQKGLDKMINECKMKGPDHDALHKWLEPLIAQLAKFKNTANESVAAHLWEAIQVQVRLYFQYFE